LIRTPLATFSTLEGGPAGGTIPKARHRRSLKKSAGKLGLPDFSSFQYPAPKGALNLWLGALEDGIGRTRRSHSHNDNVKVLKIFPMRKTSPVFSRKTGLAPQKRLV